MTNSCRFMPRCVPKPDWVLLQDKTLYTVPARRKRDHFFGAPYIKARPAGSALERSVSKCLAERGLQGGGWSTVLNGRLTGSTQETGFCRMPV